MNIFLRIFGKGSTIRVFDYLVDLDIDVSVVDICKGADLSRKTVDTILLSLIKENVVINTRRVGKTQMFKLNKENIVAKKIIQINSICLDEQEKARRK